MIEQSLQCYSYRKHINNCNMTTCQELEKHEHQYSCKDCYSWLVGV